MGYYRQLQGFFGPFLITIGCIILITWQVQPSILQLNYPNYLGCNPLTAVCFLLIGCAITGYRRYPGNTRLPGMIGLAIVLLAITRYLDLLPANTFHIDQLLYRQHLGGSRYSYPTGLCFMLIGLSLVWVWLQPKFGIRNIHYLLFPASFVILLSLVGFLLTDTFVLRARAFEPLSLITTTLFGVTIVALFVVFRSNPVMATLRSSQLGGFTARRLLPYLLIIPLTPFAFREILRYNKYNSSNFSIALLITIMFTLLFLVIVKLARLINSIDSERQKTLEQLSDKTAALEQANKQLTQSIFELDQFTYAASHDLHTPLRKISTYAGILKDTLGDSKQGAYAEKILMASRRGTRLITDLLEYSRLTHRRDAFTQVDLSNSFNDVCIDFEQTIAQTSAVIEFDPLPAIEGIPFQMSQLFSNLLGNALKFTRKGANPFIQVRLTTTEDYNGKVYLIGFSDNGIGFAQQYENRIFDAFQRLGTRSEIEGSGIGLSLCKKIVENHHGLITVESRPGHGTTFNITLPAKQPV